MKISTKGRYGLRVMLDLTITGSQSESQFVPLKEIAARQKISEKYLEQLMIPLIRSSLVRSMRGSQGGYTLMRAPEDITVGEVLRVLEGSLTPVDCAEKLDLNCPLAATCVTVEVWRQIKTAVDNVVDNITLADLLKLHIEKNGENTPVC